jgi:hypothetical protein
MVTDITLYLPWGDQDSYVPLTKKQTTRKQLAALISKYDSQWVAVVEDQPPQLLHAANWSPDLAKHIEGVELRDGMKLAVVVAGPVHKLWTRLADVEAMVSAVYPVHYVCDGMKAGQLA